MPPRADAKHNQVEAVVKTMLQAINSTTAPESYLTKPRTVQLGFFFADVTAGPRPALYIETTDWEVTDRNTRHHCDQRIAIGCVTEGLPGLSQLQKLEADVIYALIRQPSSEYPSLADGSRVERIKVLRGEPDYDRRKASGLAVSVITIEARYVFDHTAAT